MGEAVELAVDALDRGDAAWFAGARRPGMASWREALRGAPDTPAGRAVAAMARLRRMRGASTWAPLVEGPKIDRLLATCPAAEPWCVLAVADLDLFGPASALADPERGAARAQTVAGTPGFAVRAASRRAYASGSPGPLAAFEDRELDGLGRAVRAGLVPDRGQWGVAPGLVLGAATGGGASLRFFHPDVGRSGSNVVVSAFAARHGGGGEVFVETPGLVGFEGEADLLRGRTWTGEAWAPMGLVRVAPALQLRRGPVSTLIGPVARWDGAADEDGAFAWRIGHGFRAGVAWDGRSTRRVGAYAALSGEYTLPPPLAEYRRIGGAVDLRGYVRLWRMVLATRLYAEAASGEDMPIVRVPTVGGSGLHRGARPGELRGPYLFDVELEDRFTIWGPFGLTAFVDGAYVHGTGFHPGGGGGLRFEAGGPVVRVEVGVCDTGWQVVGGLGEAF